MSRAKAFWFGFAATLLVVVPLYLAAVAYSLTQSAPATVSQSGVPVVQAGQEDARTLLVMTGAQEPEEFVLVRLDAYQNTLCAVALPGQTQATCAGKVLTLRQAAQQAGPAQAAAALRETLGIPIDHYLFCTGETLAALCEAMQSVRLRLEAYLTPQALGQLQLDVPGVTSTTLTPGMLAQVLAQGAATRPLQMQLRAEGYMAFLSATLDAQPDTLTAILRSVAANTSTNLTATDVYDYQRIFKFLQMPECRAATLPGNYVQEAEEVYLPDETAQAIAAQWLGAAA